MFDRFWMIFLVELVNLMSDGANIFIVGLFFQLNVTNFLLEKIFDSTQRNTAIAVRESPMPALETYTLGLV